MPKYTYHCYKCECTIDAWHPIKEVKTTCTSCGDNKLVRVPPNFTLKKKNTNSKKQKVGDVVKQGIKKNQEILEQHKKESRKDYDA